MMSINLNTFLRFLLLVLIVIAGGVALLALIGLAGAQTAAAQTSGSQDRAALVALYNSTDGANWTNNDNWLSDAPIGDWHGVTTNDDGRVVELSLPWNQLSGPIPTELGDLANLQFMDLFNNQLTGSIPPELGGLANLEILYLRTNRLTGTIPTELGNLANLQQLNLSFNQLNGSIPSELGDLFNLQGLDLDSNQLNGSIPPELGDLAKLTALSIYDNRLTGVLPQDLTGLTALRWFWFYNNPGLCASVDDTFQSWLRSIPVVRGSSCAPADSAEDRAALVALYNATDGPNWTNSTNWLSSRPIRDWYGVVSDADGRVTELFILSNALRGTIPSELGGLANLEILNLRTNRLTGTIPTELGNLSNLQELDLSFNQLNGSIPSELGDLANLRWMNLSSNQLNGSIPPELGDLAKLRRLLLSGNQLNGPIPSQLGNLSNLELLLLADNQLTGCVPASLRNVENNDFDELGLPFCAGECVARGAVIDATNTGLISDCEALLEGRDTLAGSGSLNWSEDTPIARWEGVGLSGTPQRVTRLALPNRGLDGTISSELGRLTMLTHLNLRSNELTGEIPDQLGSLSNLRVLNLHSNSHTGDIPDLSRITGLEALYLPNNADIDADGNKIPGTGLTGEIPTWLNGMTKLRELWLWGNSLSGSVPDLSGMKSLDKLKLANNDLTGGIPEASTLPPNMTWLIIDRNPFGGTIPDMSSLSRLRLLWLHSSELTGSVPAGDMLPASLDDLNLRDNMLTGEIPDLSNLDNLTRLRLHNNSLSGEVPATLGGLDSLKYLWLHNEDATKTDNGNNAFTSIAAGVGGLADTLIVIALSGNPWDADACVPASLANVAKNDYAEAGIEACPQPQRVGSKRGFSSEHGVLSPYVEPDPINGTGRKLLAIYMVGSDLEERFLAGTDDLKELLAGFEALPDDQAVEVLVAFGGADKDGWRGMKLANIDQLWADDWDGQFGNETGANAYLYQADGAHMGDESSLTLFLDYLRDGYVNFDQRFLTFWDHGGSYKGFGGDTNFNSDDLSMDEIAEAFQNSEPGGFDLIGFDACQMASVEVAKVFEPHAQYMIASEADEPGHGWFWTSVIEAYAQEDSIVEAGKLMVDDFIRNQDHAGYHPKTLSLLDLSEYDTLISALDPVVSALGDELFDNREYSDALIASEMGAQEYGVDEKSGTRTSIDLMHFAQLLKDYISDTELDANLDDLIYAVKDRFVIHSKHDGDKPNSFGIAIDAPGNTDDQYLDYKVNDTWLDFQSAYKDFLEADEEPPVVIREYTDSEGTFATVRDENLALVTTLQGFIAPIEYEDGTVEEFFMVVADDEAPQIEDEEDLYLASTWDQVWFTVEYDPEALTAWIPAFFSGVVERDGLEYRAYTAEIDYQQADKDYSGYEYPYDFATITLIVDDDGEYWEIVDHYVKTYQFLYSGPDDEVGEVLFDKADYRLGPGDRVQFLNFGFSLEDEANDGWFYTGDGVVTFVQEPVFLWEFLEFVDESGEPFDYYYAIWAEDASGNPTLGELIPSQRVVDSPFGSMQVFKDPWNGFEVQVPQPWIEEEPDTASFEVFVAYDPEGSGSVSIYVEDGIPVSLAEYADDLEAGLLEAGVEDLTREDVETIQGLPAVLFEGVDGEEGFIWLAYLSDDGLAIDILYWFPIDQFDAGRELAYYSFDTFLVD